MKENVIEILDSLFVFELNGDLNDKVNDNDGNIVTEKILELDTFDEQCEVLTYLIDRYYMFFNETKQTIVVEKILLKNCFKDHIIKIKKECKD